MTKMNYLPRDRARVRLAVRRKLPIVLGAIATVLSVFSNSALADRHAFVIGISEYYHNKNIKDLKYAHKDAEEMEKVLTEAGYKVSILTNRQATRLRILEMFRDYASTLSSDDDFLLYFSGHGVRDTLLHNTPFWLTHDVDPNHLDLQGIRLNHLMDYVDDIRSDRKLILLDHCYSGDVNFTRTQTTAIDVNDDSPKDGLSTGSLTGTIQDKSFNPLPADISTQLVAAKGTAVIAAARNLAFESADLRHGIFTKSLLNAFGGREADTDGNGDGKLSLLELVEFLDKDIPRITPSDAPTQEMKRSFSKTNDDQLSFMRQLILDADLPVGDLEKIADYSKIVKQWALNGKITGDDKLTVLAALKLPFDDSELAGQPVEKKEAWLRLADDLSSILSASHFTEFTKIRLLKEAVTDLKEVLGS